MSLLAQYKSSLGITLNGNDVSLWEDQSGNGNDIEQTIAINQPEFVPNAHLGHPVLRFTGAEFLEALNNTVLNLGNSDMTIVAVHKPSIVGAARILGKQDGGGGNAKGYQIFQNNPSQLNFKVGDGTDRRDSVSSNDVLILNGLNISVCQFDATPKLTAQENNGVDAENTATTTGSMTGTRDATVKFTIGMTQADMVLRFKGDILEVRVYDNLEDFSTLHTELDDLYSNQLPVLVSIDHSGNDIEQSETNSGFRPVTKTVKFDSDGADLVAWEPSSLGFSIVLTGVVMSTDVDTTIILKGLQQGVIFSIPIKANIPFKFPSDSPIWAGNKGENIVFDVSDSANTKIVLIGYETS